MHLVSTLRTGTGRRGGMRHTSHCRISDNNPRNPVHEPGSRTGFAGQAGRRPRTRLATKAASRVARGAASGAYQPSRKAKRAPATVPPAASAADGGRHGRGDQGDEGHGGDGKQHRRQRRLADGRPVQQRAHRLCVGEHGGRLRARRLPPGERDGLRHALLGPRHGRHEDHAPLEEPRERLVVADVEKPPRRHVAIRRAQRVVHEPRSRSGRRAPRRASRRSWASFPAAWAARGTDPAHHAVLVARQEREGERARVDAAQERIVDRHDLAARIDADADDERRGRLGHRQGRGERVVEPGNVALERGTRQRSVRARWPAACRARRAPARREACAAPGPRGRPRERRRRGRPVPRRGCRPAPAWARWRAGAESRIEQPRLASRPHGERWKARPASASAAATRKAASGDGRRGGGVRRPWAAS